MLKPTNDPIRAYRREMEATARATREGNSAGGTQSFQAVAKLQQQIEELRELVLRLPQNFGRQVSASGFDLVPYNEWETLATATIARPPQFTRAVVSVNSMVTTLAHPPDPEPPVPFAARIIINGVVSDTFPGEGYPDGFPAPRFTSYPSFVQELSGMTASQVTVSLQAQGYGHDYFPQENKASLSVTAGFSTI